MCRKSTYLVLIALALSAASGPAMAGILYGNPPGGWTYTFQGDAAASAATAALDGKWDHYGTGSDGSDAWDGLGIGAGVGAPGGVSALLDGTTSFLRMQDCGDPRDHGSADPSNRKIYFAHNITADGAPSDILDSGVTLTFRARIATGTPLDPMYPDTAGGSELNTTPGGTAWPAGGNGYVSHDGGKDNFGIRGLNDKMICFALSLATDDDQLAALGSGLTMNKLNGSTVTDAVDIWDNDPGTIKMLPISDLKVWHEFFINIKADTSGGGTHLVKIWMDGSMTPTEFHVTATNANDGNYGAFGFLSLGVGATPEMGAIDVDFFSYKPGLYSPGVENKASNGAPHNTMVYADSVTLTWSPGASAALHDVYFSDNFNDVNAADSSDPMGSDKVYKARQSDLKYPPPDPDPFATIPVTWGKTYYWRIDEVNDVNTWRGDIWSFEVLSNLNWNPSPPHQARFVPVTTDLSWSKGALAVEGHIIYLSTDFAAVNNVAPGTMTPGVPPYLGYTSPAAVTSIVIPGDLLKGTTYYWRADPVEKNLPLTVHKGAVWQFETMPAIPITDPTLIGWWTFDEGADETIVIDWSGYGNHGAIVGGAQRTPGQIEDAIELNGSGQNVAIANFDEIADVGGAALPETSIAMWARPDTVSGQRMMWFTHESGSGGGYGKVRCRIDGGTWQIRHGQGATGNNVDAIGPTAVAGEWVHYVAIRKNNDALYVYINGVLGGSAAFAVAGNPAVTSWIGAEEGTGNYFDGLIDDVRVYSKALSAAEIRILAGLFEAYDPLPADEAVGVATTPTLDWLPGARAASHDVYFGTNYADVKAGTGGTFKGNQPLADTDYVPSPALTAGKAYYWKITEVNDAHADKKWEGPVWVFRVAGGAGGLLGAYYQHTGGAAPAGFETFKLSRIDPEVNFNWGVGSPDALIDINDFSCRWSGQVEAPVSEDYIFYTASDDGARLWVDGQLVIDHWVDQGGTEWPSSPIALVAGQKYDIVMEQYENEGGATAYLRWSSPSTSKRIIPPIWLWPPTKATNPVPPDMSTTAPLQPTLSWTAGLYAAAAAGHRVYFDADEQRVIARAGCQVNGISTTNPTYLLPWTFGLEETYYWAVDEVNGVKSWQGDTWSFITTNNKVVDDMEKYVPNVANPSIYQVWVDGAGDCASIPGNNSGALVDTRLTPVHGDQQAMMLVYDNDGTVDNPCNPGVPATRLKYSKVEALVAQLPSGIGSDWTVGGVTKVLSLWFYGDPSNSIETMWVQLTDSSNNKAKVFYGKYADEDINDMNEASWDGHEWLIDLEDFNVPPTRVNVKNVKSIAIGVGDDSPTALPGGAGTLYFDDIRLYTPRCVLTRRSADFAALDYAPEALGGDCVINARELEIMTRDWLLADSVLSGDPIPPAANLILHYKFELNLLDSSVNGLHGAPGGSPTYGTRGSEEKTIVLAGGDYVNCGNPPQLDFSTGNWTVAAWIKAIATTDQRMIYCKGGDGNGGIRYMLTLAETNDHRMTVTTDDNVDKYQRHGDIRVDDGEWHHVVGMRDGTALRVYVDGIDDGATTIPAGYDLSGTSQANAFIGANWDYETSVVQKFFVGAIDDVRIYDYALTQNQILTVMAYIPLMSPAELYHDEARGSKVINFRDYAVLTDRWLEEDMYP